jgi:hypothetical protein
MTTTTATPWTWTEVDAADLKIGDVVQDSYGNAAIVIVPVNLARPHRVQVTIMQMDGSDRGRNAGLPLYVRRLDTPTEAERIREIGRQVWREKFSR